MPILGTKLALHLPARNPVEPRDESWGRPPFERLLNETVQSGFADRRNFCDLDAPQSKQEPVVVGILFQKFPVDELRGAIFFPKQVIWENRRSLVAIHGKILPHASSMMCGALGNFPLFSHRLWETRCEQFCGPTGERALRGSGLRDGLTRLGLAGAAGFEPANAGTKNRCLTTWRRPSRRSRLAGERRL